MSKTQYNLFCRMSLPRQVPNVNCADRGIDTDNVNPVSVAALINTGTC